MNNFFSKQFFADIIFAMTGACGVAGGIATHNLNILHALVKLSETRGTGLIVLSLLEEEANRPSFLPDWVDFQAFQGNKIAFSFHLLFYAIKSSVCIFDHVTLALPVLPYAKTGITKTVIFAHGSEAWKHIRRSSPWSFQSASLCLANSEYTLNNMRNCFDLFNGKVCSLGLSPEFPLNPEIRNISNNSLELVAVDGHKYTLSRRFFLLVARMQSTERQKGHYALLKILPALLKEYPDVQFVFPGPGDDISNLEHLARQLNVASSVFFPGYVSIQMLELLYKNCYAFAMPSKQEGFGLVYLEAMNYGKPCIGCFDDAGEEVILHGETGLLVQDPNDSEELLEVLRILLNNPEQTQMMGKKGFERLHRHFTAQQVQDRLISHIANIL